MRLKLVMSGLMILALAGCGGDNGTARQIIGFDRKAPDAFSVSTHAPLEVPPNLDAPLPPPRPGAPRPQEISPQQRARALVLAEPLSAAPSQNPRAVIVEGAEGSAPSAAESALLQQAGAQEANPQIRATVNAEADEDKDGQHGPLDWLVFWRHTPRPGVAVDADAEAARLAANRAAGKPVTEGGTPVHEDSGRLSVPKEIE